jgi:hypothetical protein
MKEGGEEEEEEEAAGGVSSAEVAHAKSRQLSGV